MGDAAQAGAVSAGLKATMAAPGMLRTISMRDCGLARVGDTDIAQAHNFMCGVRDPDVLSTHRAGERRSTKTR
jgi:hypothetical protein